VDKDSGVVVLTISDHLDWADSRQHQVVLQDKINAYLAFVESGELLERYAEAKGRPVVFQVVFKFRPDTSGLQFLTKAKEVIESAGFTLRYEAFAESYDN
jgi:hypothetical protein